MNVFTPPDIEKAIFDAAEEISNAADSMRAAHEDALRTDREYDRAYAFAYVDSDGPAHERRYRAEVHRDVQDARDARDAAEVTYKYFVSRSRAAERKLDALRSIGTSVRQTYNNTGY